MSSTIPRNLLIASILLLLSPALAASECVVLLHGLARTSASMDALEERLRGAGYSVANIDYPSREKPIEELAPQAVNEGLARCARNQPDAIHFVTHSLGGILVRYFYRDRRAHILGRVVMLGPPNQGSEVVDNFREVPGFYELNGPAGQQLGTGPDDIPRQLGPVNFELGVVAGTTSINLILSTFLPDPDDGKVSVSSTRVEGMRDFISLPVSHPFIMEDDDVIAQVLHFLSEGRFNHPQANNNDNWSLK